MERRVSGTAVSVAEVRATAQAAISSAVGPSKEATGGGGAGTTTDTGAGDAAGAGTGDATGAGMETGA